jgi:hypothetical protein
LSGLAVRVKADWWERVAVDIVCNLPVVAAIDRDWFAFVVEVPDPGYQFRFIPVTPFDP